MTGRRAGWLRSAAGLGVAGAAGYFFFRERGLFAGFGTALTHLSWYWLPAAFAAELASVPPLAEVQRMVLRTGGVEPAWFRMNLVTLASNAISASVPAGVAVSEGYAFARYRRFGANAAVAAWSELAAGAIAFCALAALALAGVALAGGADEPILLGLLAVVFAGSAAAATAFRRPWLLVRALSWVEKRLGPPGRLLGRRTGGFWQTARTLTHVRPSAARWTAAWGLSALNVLLDAICLALSFAAVRAAIPWGAVLPAFAAGKVVGSIGVTPGGLGAVEGGLVATFIAYGVAGSNAAAAVLIYRGLTVIGLVGTGWLAAAALAVAERRQARLPGPPPPSGTAGRR